MSKTLTITYDKSNEDTPVLCVAENGFLSMTPNVIKIFTGEKAESLYKELTGQNVIVELKEENNQKPIKRTKYIDGDLLFSKIAGHSDYHGDNILSAISCLQEGKEISTISAIGDNE